MKSVAVAMALCTLISSASAADQTCKAKAIKQKLAGEALLNFVKQCETDAMVACANKTAGKPDSDTLMDACVAMRLEWGLGGASRIIAVRTLIARAVLDVRFAGPDFVDGNSQWLKVKPIDLVIHRTDPFWCWRGCRLGLVCRVARASGCAHRVEPGWCGRCLSRCLCPRAAVRRAGHH